MTDLMIDGMAISPTVVETIVQMAAADVEGVSGVGALSGNEVLAFIGLKPSTSAVEVEVDEQESLHVSLRMGVKSGYVLPEVADAVRQAVADAVATQVGVSVGSVDIYIDSIQFDK